MEQLAAGGIESLDVLAGARTTELREVLEDGERWGVSLVYHVAEDPYAALHALPGLDAEPDVLLVHADTLVAAADWSAAPLPPGALEVYVAGAGSPAWTGWCRCPGSLVAAAGPALGRNTLLAALARRATSRIDVHCDALSARDPAELLAANRRAVAGRAPFVSIHGRRGPDGVWTQHGVRVHPTAVLEAPLFLGECVEVGPGAHLGPAAVIGAGSIVDGGAVVRNSLIARQTYVAGGAYERVVGLNGGVHLDRDGRALAGLVDLRSASVAASVRQAVTAWLERVTVLAQTTAQALWALVPHEPSDELAT